MPERDPAEPRRTWDEVGKQLKANPPREIKLKLYLYADRIEGECPDCGFDALIQIKGYELRTTGVKCWFNRTDCGRCIAERKRNG